MTYQQRTPADPPNVCIVGCGYVGLTTGVCLARLGNYVSGLDTDERKIESLQRGIPPIHEPHLKDFLAHSSTNISFTTDSSVVTEADVIFVTVPTPVSTDGQWDLSYIETAFRNIGNCIRDDSKYRVVINKCTAPVGTTTRMSELLAKHGVPSSHLDVIANPEFLSQNSAITDFLHPHRIVVGSHSEPASNLLLRLYRPIIEQDFPFDVPERSSPSRSAVPIITTDPATAEMIKYASNAFLATKVSFINEVGNVCTRLGVDVDDVATGMGLDARISSHFLEAGGGFGGSCLPKDTRALAGMARAVDIEPYLLDAVLDVNRKQPMRMIEMAEARLGELRGKRIGILGVTFKPDTDDIRESIAGPIIEELLQRGAILTVYDPMALDKIAATFGEGIICAKNAQEAVLRSDCVLILTAWDEFKENGLLGGKFVIDARRTVPQNTGEDWVHLCGKEKSW